jgi:heptosyltransferase II
MRVLIRATNWVGDAIMALPALLAVRERLPGAHIAILALPYVAEVYRGQGVADELIRYERAGEHAGIRGRERLAAGLKERRFDAALLLQNAFDAAWLAWRAGIPERIGYRRDARGLLLTKALPVPKPGEIPAHEKYYYLELLRRAGWLDALPEAGDIRLRLTPEQSREAEARLRGAGSAGRAPRVAVGAGASYGSAKCWPPERFARALNQLGREREIEIVLFGTPAEGAVSKAIVAGLERPAVDLTGKTSVGELAPLLSRCSLFLGNDSGAMHVAAAAGLAVVAIFGPTDAIGTAPATHRATIIQEKPYCSPCFLRRCPTDHRCMTAIAPERVGDALLRVLAEVSAG